MANETAHLTVPASVVIPTVGRTALLMRCLASVLATDPAPSEIVVVDQSGGAEVFDATARLGAGDLLRVVPNEGRGIAKATNSGVEAVRNQTVLVTHDDCTVAADWVGQGMRLLRGQPSAIFTGRVLPPADAEYVPSTIDGKEPRDYTGRITSGVLYPANMVFDRDRMIEFGGFDERAGLFVAAEDNDFCYRWLVDGHPLRFEPSLVVWHHDWRTPEQLQRTHVAYARGQGAFYAKHLLARDRRILALLRWDLIHGVRACVRGTACRIPRWKNPYREMVGSLLRGLVTELWRSRHGSW
ncbi:MAG: glycosyltransferase [Acidimicrobiales bacterium]